MGNQESLWEGDQKSTEEYLRGAFQKVSESMSREFEEIVASEAEEYTNILEHAQSREDIKSFMLVISLINSSERRIAKCAGSIMAIQQVQSTSSNPSAYAGPIDSFEQHMNEFKESVNIAREKLGLPPKYAV